jgi:mannose-6-phosphate isomerase-like protein (cupin superfamily)
MFFKYPKDFTCIDYKPGEKAEYVWGKGILLARVLVNSETAGSVHESEQISLVLDGEFDLNIGGETRRVKKGDAFHIPAGVRHTVTKVIAKPIEIIDVWPVGGPQIPD